MVLTSLEIEAMRRELSEMGLEIRAVKRYGPKRQLIVKIDDKVYRNFEDYLIAVYGSFYRGVKGKVIEEALKAYLDS